MLIAKRGRGESSFRVSSGMGKKKKKGGGSKRGLGAFTFSRFDRGEREGTGAQHRSRSEKGKEEGKAANTSGKVGKPVNIIPVNTEIGRGEKGGEEG